MILNHRDDYVKSDYVKSDRLLALSIGVQNRFVMKPSRMLQALIDRRLYLPESCASDQARQAQAHVPEKIAFATKPEIARSPHDAQVPCSYVLADSAFGPYEKCERCGFGVFHTGGSKQPSAG